MNNIVEQHVAKLIQLITLVKNQNAKRWVQLSAGIHFSLKLLKFHVYIVQCHFSVLECGQFMDTIFQNSIICANLWFLLVSLTYGCACRMTNPRSCDSMPIYIMNICKQCAWCAVWGLCIVMVDFCNALNLHCMHMGILLQRSVHNCCVGSVSLWYIVL